MMLIRHCEKCKYGRVNFIDGKGTHPVIDTICFIVTVIIGKKQLTFQICLTKCQVTPVRKPFIVFFFQKISVEFIQKKLIAMVSYNKCVTYYTSAYNLLLNSVKINS